MTMTFHVPLRRCLVLVQSSTRHLHAAGSNPIWREALKLRCLSTSPSPTTKEEQEKQTATTTTQEEEDKEPITWLYQRTPDQMMKPRVILGLASFHTLYWSWYVVDFMPAVNQSPLEHFHIDPVVGHVGMFFSIFVNFGAALYPWSLISGMGIRGTKELCVFTHTSPMMRPAKKGVVYEIGNVCMDPSTEETKKIVETLGGDLASYRGFVALKANRRRLPYLLQIQDSTEVLDSWKQVLVNPELAKKEVQRSADSSDESSKSKRSGKKRAKTSRGSGKKTRARR